MEEHEERRGARSSKLAEHPLPFLIGSERQRAPASGTGSLPEQRQEGLETKWKMPLDYNLLITWECKREALFFQSHLSMNIWQEVEVKVEMVQIVFEKKCRK